MQFIIKISNYKESLRKISKHKYEIQQKFSKTMNVSLQLLKKNMNFKKSITRINGKLFKNVRIFHNI